MKSFAAAALIGATSAEHSFIDMITNMALQEAEAAKHQAAQPKFAFQELLTQMAVDEIEAHEAAKIDYNPIQMLTNMAIAEYEKQQAKPTINSLMTTMLEDKMNTKSFVEVLSEMHQEEKAMGSMHEAFVNMAIEHRAKPKQTFTDLINNIVVEERSKPTFGEVLAQIHQEEKAQGSLHEAFVNMAMEHRAKPKQTFTDLINNIVVEERSKPTFGEVLAQIHQEEKAQQGSIHEAFVNMAIEHKKQPKESFIGVLTNLALQQKNAKTFTQVLAEVHETKKSEQMALFSHGIPHAIASMVAKDHMKNQVNAKQEFLKDLLHPESVYEPFSLTAMKAAVKFYQKK